MLWAPATTFGHYHDDGDDDFYDDDVDVDVDVDVEVDVDVDVDMTMTMTMTTTTTMTVTNMNIIDLDPTILAALDAVSRAEDMRAGKTQWLSCPSLGLSSSWL